MSMWTVLVQSVTRQSVCQFVAAGLITGMLSGMGVAPVRAAAGGAVEAGSVVWAAGQSNELPAVGTWWGLMWFGEKEQRISLKFSKSPEGVWKGYVDLLRTDDRRIPVSEVVAEGAGLKFSAELQTGKVVFDGVIEGYVVEGNFEGPGGTGRFRAEREPPRRPRVQEPVGKVPYEVKELTISSGDVKLGATLTVPAEVPAVGAPAVLLVTAPNGRGRDQDAAGHKPFLVLADRLTRAGYVVLRFDDRTLVRSSLQSVADAQADAVSAMKVLREVPGVRKDRVAVIGFSEGALIAAELAALPSDGPNALVLLNPNATTGLDTKPRQLSRTVGAMGVPGNYGSQYVIREMAAFQAVADGDTAALRSAVISLLALRSGDQRDEVIDGETRFGKQADTEMLQYASAWNKYFLTTDPTLVLKKIKIPVLTFSGTNDSFFNTEETTPLLESALKLGSKDYSVEVVPMMNHQLQTSRSGLTTEVSSIEETINEPMLARMIAWLDERTKK